MFFFHKSIFYLAFDEFRQKGYVNVIEDVTPTNISKRHLEGSKTYDNIWILQGTPDKQEYTGRSGTIVYRIGLFSCRHRQGKKNSKPLYKQRIFNEILLSGSEMAYY